jgi:hypothetical protein
MSRQTDILRAFTTGGPKVMPPVFIMLALDDRGRFWWFDSRGLTFPPIVRKFCFPCDRWQRKENSV